MSKESFKEFIRGKPYLAKAVYDNKVTFQKLYEIYDIYGEDSEVFEKYIDDNSNNSRNSSFSEISNILKGIDLNTIQKGVSGLQKVITLVQEVVPNKNENNQINNIYEERPINKYYED